MAIDFNALKANRKQSAQKMSEAMADMDKSGGFKRDPRLWKPSMNKETGRGMAIVRPLPAGPGEEKAVHKVISYNFNGPGGWFNEVSPRTIGEACPVAEENNRLWNEDGSKQAQSIARQRKQNVKFYMNVYVVKDDVFPENEGKVFIMECGKQIYTGLSKHLNPKGIKDRDMTEDEIENGIREFNPFDMWEGADLKITVTQREMKNNKGEPIQVPNYIPRCLPESEFFEGNDEKKEEIWKQCHALNDFTDPSKIKSFEELQERLEKVSGQKQKRIEDNQKSMPSEDAQEAPTLDNLEQDMKTIDSTPAPKASSGVEDDDDLEALLAELQG